MKNTHDDNEEEIKGLYFICDGGYHKWRCMQCPVKNTSAHDLRIWSKWLESVRKDIECTFGILKGRFRILKIPILLQSKEEIDNVLFTCCCLHNEIMRDDNLFKLWEQGVEWNGPDGFHDLCDIDKAFKVHRENNGKLKEVENEHTVIRNKFVNHFMRMCSDKTVVWS